MNSCLRSNFIRQFMVMYVVTNFVLSCANFSTVQNHNDKTEFNRIPSSGNSDLSYELCNEDEKFYIEDQILNLPQEYFSTKSTDVWMRTIPKVCVLVAQKNYSGKYAQCDSKNSKPVRTNIRPCLTENYTNIMYNAFLDMTDCFGVDPKSIFLQIMVESGFHINAISSTSYDSGVSQFTSSGIKRALANGSYFRIQNILATSSSKSCERISSVIKNLSQDSAKVTNRCEMISLPQNPYLSFVLFYSHTFKDRMYFKYNFANEFPKIAKILTEENIDQLTMLAYNRGITGALKLLVGYYNDRVSMGIKLQAEDFNLMVNMHDLRKKLSEANVNKADLLKRKVSRLSFAEYLILNDVFYMTNIAEARDFMKTRTGEMCF